MTSLTKLFQSRYRNDNSAYFYQSGYDYNKQEDEKREKIKKRFNI